MVQSQVCVVGVLGQPSQVVTISTLFEKRRESWRCPDGRRYSD